MNAAELDRYIAAKDAYTAAKARGASEDEAIQASKDVVAKKRREQVLRSVGVGAEGEAA